MAAEEEEICTTDARAEKAEEDALITIDDRGLRSVKTRRRIFWRISLSSIVVLTIVVVCSCVAWRKHVHSTPIKVPSTASVTDLYMPSVHRHMLEQALDAAYADKAGKFAQLMQTLDHVVAKNTAGSCKLLSCTSFRGPTDCLLDTCVCKYGYGTQDGDKCIPLHHISTSYPTVTTHRCEWTQCPGWYGPTDCISGKCICKAGYVTLDGERCVLLSDHAKDCTHEMMAAGIVEPDELPCPGSTLEMGSQVADMMWGTRKYEVGLCRLSIQVYHGSPLPLVRRNRLHFPPEMNGDNSANNAGSIQGEDLYAIMTNSQWRTSMVQMMAKQFTYALVMHDVVESARRLGNIFHTLTDTWSASHVVRRSPGAAYNPALCNRYIIDTAVSMDTVNWAVHSMADKKDDDALYLCGRYFVQKAIQLWAELRINGALQNRQQVNHAINRLVTEVLCPSLPINNTNLHKPAGGAPADLSSDYVDGKAVKPVGTAAVEDMDRILAEWDASLAEARAAAGAKAKLRFGHNIFLPPRNHDVCSWGGTSHAHVSNRFFMTALRDSGRKAPNYLMPAPLAHAVGPPPNPKEIELPLLKTDKDPKFEKQDIAREEIGIESS